jgi:putative NADH-flavin reductase
VTAIARNASKLGERAGVTVKDLDVLDTDMVAFVNLLLNS